MGLLRDYLIKDPKTKRKVTIAIHISIIIAFIVAMIIPTFKDIAYAEGYEFGNKTCISKFDYLYENLTNMTGDFDVMELPEGFFET